MDGYLDNIEELTLKNVNFREVLYTGRYSQLVVMCLKPGEDIGDEVHDTVDQFFRVEAGRGKVVMNGVEREISDGSAIVIPAGMKHNLINTSNSDDLKLYTIYSPSNHKPGTKHVTRDDAMRDEHHH